MKSLLYIVFTLLLSVSVMAGNPVTDLPPGEIGVITSLKVYPNPSSSGVFTIEFDKLNEDDNLSIRVYNLIGKEIMSRQINSHDPHFEDQINLSHLPKGIYVLEVTNGREKKTKRLSFI